MSPSNVFAEPIAREEDVLAIIGRLAQRLQFALERRGDGARRIELTLFRTDGVVRRLAAGTSRPLRDPGEIRALFVERLAAFADALDPGFGFDMARLSVVVAEPCPPEQIGFGGGEDTTELCRLVDRLSARLGARRVHRLMAQDSIFRSWPKPCFTRAGRQWRCRLECIPPLSRDGSTSTAATAVARSAGANRGGGRSTGRPALALPMAARAARSGRRRRPRAHRGHLVERARRSCAGLLPRRGQKRPALLAVSRRALPRPHPGAAAPAWFLHGTFA